MEHDRRNFLRLGSQLPLAWFLQSFSNNKLFATKITTAGKNKHYISGILKK